MNPSVSLSRPGEVNIVSERYKIVSVKLDPSGKTYDYLCGLPVEKGDRVVVETFLGEQIVTVEAVAEYTEPQLRLPLARYKSVVRIFDRGDNPPKGRLEEFRDALVEFHAVTAGADPDAVRPRLRMLCDKYGFDFDEVIDTAFKRRALRARFEASGIADPLLSLMCGGSDEEVDQKYHDTYGI